MIYRRGKHGTSSQLYLLGPNVDIWLRYILGSAGVADDLYAAVVRIQIFVSLIKFRAVTDHGRGCSPELASEDSTQVFGDQMSLLRSHRQTHFLCLN